MQSQSSQQKLSYFSFAHVLEAKDNEETSKTLTTIILSFRSYWSIILSSVFIKWRTAEFRNQIFQKSLL